MEIKRDKKSGREREGKRKREREGGRKETEGLREGEGAVSADKSAYGNQGYPGYSFI